MPVGNELLLGLALGLSLAAPPGPMNAWIVAASTRSYRSAVATGLGAVSADALLGMVVYLVYRSVAFGPAFRAVYGLGAVVMAVFAYRLLSTARAATPPEPELRTYVQALGLGLSNPFQVLWWLTAGIGFAYVGGPPLLIGLFGALLVWVAAFPAAVRAGLRRSPRVEPAVRIGSAVAMAAFAVYFVVLALGR